MRDNGHTEADLIAACLRGDPRAFERLVGRYKSLVCSLTYSAVGRLDLSEELAQEAFVRAWSSLAQLQDAARFKSWLCSITRSVILNHHRRKKREPLACTDRLNDLPGSACPQPGPSEILISREEEAMISQALMRIPEMYRDPLVLFYREDRSIRQVADLLDEKEATIRVRLHRGRQMLRAEVEAMVERGLQKSKPGAGFTKAVMLAVGSIAIGSAAVAEATTTGPAGFAGAAAGTTPASVGTAVGLKIAAAAAAVILGTSGLLFYLSHPEPASLPPVQAVLTDAASPQSTAQPQPAAVPAQEAPVDPIINEAKLKTIAAVEEQTKPQPPAKLKEPAIQPTVAPEPYQFTPRGVLSGLITDVNTLEPIADLEISISCSPNDDYQHTKTDPNGMYWFANIKADGDYIIEFESPVYITPERWRYTNETIQLKKDTQTFRHYQFQKGCKIRAEVVNEYNQPLKEFSVYAAYVSDIVGRGPKRDVRTNEKGKAFIGGLKPEEYQVTVTGNGYAPAFQKIKFDRHFQEKKLRFILQPGISVFGRAVCEDGLPAGGWKIAPEPAWWHSVYCVPHSSIDQEGYFELKNILPGEYKLEIFVPMETGFSGIWSTFEPLPPDSGLIAITIPYASPSQRVTQKVTIQYMGSPPPTGFWIWAVSADGNRNDVHVEKGKTEFEIKNMVPGLYTFEIDREPIKMKFQNIEIPQDNLVLQIPTRKQTVLRGKVIDRETNLPIEKFTVNQIAYEDPQGEFTCEVYGTESRRVELTAEGYFYTPSPEMVPDADEPTLIAMSPVKADGIIEGTIVNEEGLPVPEVKVRFRYEPGDSRPAAITDAEGRFTLNDLQQDSSGHWLVFEHADYALLTRQITTEGNALRQVQVVLSKGGIIEGFVYDENGLPLPDTPLYFLDESNYSYWKQGRARLAKVITDHRGYYWIEKMPPILCYGYREDPDNKLGVVTTSILPQKDRAVSLDFGGLSSVTGKILRDNQPVPKLNLLIKGSPSNWETAFTAYARTDETGRFVFRGIPTGSRYLFFEIAGLKGHERWVELGRFNFPDGQNMDLGTFTIDFAQATVSFAGEDPNELFKQYEVSLYRFNENSFSKNKTGKLLPRYTVSDPYTFALLPPGKYEAIASREGYPSIRQTFEVVPGEQSHTVEIQIPTGTASVFGTVTLNDDDRRSLIALTLYNREQTLTFDFSPAGDGRFTLNHLPPGEYAVAKTWHMLSRQSSLVEFTLKPQEKKEIQFSMSDEKNPDGIMLVLPVTGGGLPLPGTRITLERNGQILYPNLESEMSVDFHGEPGPWTLYAEYPGYRSVIQPVTMKNIKECSLQEILDPVVIRMLH